jgi:outer membrane receptor for Fe3+-dicitrate
VNDGNFTPNSPQTLASWGVMYAHERTGLWARVGGSHTGPSFKDPENFEEGSADGVNGPLPGYTLWDAAIGWNQCPDGAGFALSVGVTNFTDYDYFRRFSTGIYPGAPRQFFATASYTAKW